MGKTQWHFGFALLGLWATLACSDSSSADASGAGPGTDGAPSSAQDLFSDPNVPSCTISSSVSDMRIRGTIDGQLVSVQQIPGTYFEQGRLYVPDGYLTDAGYKSRNDLDLGWSGKLGDGQLVELTGGSVYIPADQPRGDMTYCFAKGQLAVYAADPMNAGRLFKFRLRELAVNADCSGGPVTGELVGCIHRYNPDIP